MSAKTTFRSVIRNFFTKNVGYKILSLIIAMILWFIYSGLEDPGVNENFRVKLQVEHLEEFLSANNYIELKDGSSLEDYYVNVTLRGARSRMQVLSEQNISDVISVSVDLFELENGVLRLHYNINEAYQNLVELPEYSNTNYISVVTEEIGTVTIDVSLKLTGKAASGYSADGNDAVMSQKSIVLTGPISKISKIAYAYATVDMAGAKMDVTSVASLHFADERNKEITLDFNQIGVSANLITVQIPVYYSTSIPVLYDLTGTPADGFKLTDKKLSQEKINVLIRMNEAELPKEQPLFTVDLKDKSGELSATYDIQALLNKAYSGRVTLNQKETELSLTLTIDAE